MARPGHPVRVFGRSRLGWWDRVFAAAYDCVNARLEPAIALYRIAAAGPSTGDVLEIGGGTGANLLDDPWDARLTVVEPNPGMAARRRATTARSGRTVTIIEEAAERLPFPDASFDAVVVTLDLCSVADPSAVLAEIRRVPRSGEASRFVAHVAAEDPHLLAWPRRIRPIWRIVAAGCEPDRPTGRLIESAGFARTSVEARRVPVGPPFTQTWIAGEAIHSVAGPPINRLGS